LLAADDGSIWFGTFGGGVAFLKDGEWTAYDTSSSMSRSLRSFAFIGSAFLAG
jgi:hypothetical protein